MSSFAFVFALLVAWAYFAFTGILNRRYLTQLQKQRYEDAAWIMLIVLTVISAADLIILDQIENEAYAYASIFGLNALLVVVFWDRRRDNNKSIYANQKLNFSDLPTKKSLKIKKQIKGETDIDKGYYHIEPVIKKNDMTVEEVRIGEETLTEYDSIFRKSIKKPFKPHLVYEKLITYYNDKGAKYGLKSVDYDDFIKKMQKGKKSRATAELNITTLYLRLVDKKIPIRISQLLQHTGGLRYLDGYIYFLMGLSSGRYVPKAVLYAIFHIKHHTKFKKRVKNEPKR